MRARSIWLKPYQRIDAEDGGVLQHSLVAFRKRPGVYEMVDNQQEVVQYNYNLYIDAWFVKLEIAWRGKYKGELEYDDDETPAHSTEPVHKN